ncbi:MAG: NAD(P)H-quinone oxidoreductase [Actinomycetota bacterium]|nr:quinone oxidoreductase [Acidimicrobiaceae bacterium]MCH2625665.1 NAD(P)H-quinone oxidoreductase [Acidimicrobiales bacterium]MEC7873702.1 NAD(P)H-quinone oxidoreductase [Actinomycetota bacterium]MCS5682123.1 NAD(P)H-quinone oxidoreductase [Acidimicrobiales bacterium]MEC8828276.1 NAD(P)H-quinone oxidoreductase [Actinomycetota bacterium]|tara:strand:- start:1477 stop:2457 length:981 start_codon:yes stop_codon:yes gene_type:complete
MRAVVIPEYGDVNVLELKELPDPEPGPDQVLVEVVASAMNRADLLQRMGQYPAPGPKPLHEIPGLEFSGRVGSIGAEVQRWSIGDEVMGIVAGGGMAGKVVTHERMLQAVPQNVDLADAAAIPEVFMTAHDALVTQGNLTSGGRALVHAGASGVGTASIQIANAIGARIAVTCSTNKVDSCRELGADLIVDYTKSDFVEEVELWTQGQGVDVVLDVIGGDYLGKNLQCLKTQGRIIQVGVMGGPATSFALGALLPKRASLIGTVLRSRPIEQKIEANQRFVAELLPLFDEGTLKPVIDSRYRLEDIADAHLYMESNANVGKILIDI